MFGETRIYSKSRLTVNTNPCIAYACGLEAASSLIMSFVISAVNYLRFPHLYTSYSCYKRILSEKRYFTCFLVDMSLRAMGQTWVSSSLSSRIVHVVNGNQTEIADVIASSLTAPQEHRMPKWAEHTKPPKTPKILAPKRLRWR